MLPEDSEETAKVEKISAWIDGEMTPEAILEFTESLEKDKIFRLEAHETKAAWDLLDHLPKAENNPALTNRTMALLQLGDIRPESDKRGFGGSTSQEARLMPMLGWWGLLASVLALSFGISYGFFSSANQTNSDKAKYLWLDAASVSADYRNDTEFLKWLVAPERFGTAKP